MSNAIAFFPWVRIREPLEVGSVRLLPFVRGKVPGDLSNVTQKDMDAVLGSYATRPRKVVREATLLEFSGWRLGTNVDGHVSALFHARELIAFSALAKRRFFQGHFDYTNSDTYALTVQRYAPGEGGTFAFNTRRRDGGTNNLWSSDEFAFGMPLHVVADHQAALDIPLLDALLKLGPEHDYITESIKEFNAANTDAIGIPAYAELVMMKSAWEWLLRIGHKASDFGKGLNALLGPPSGDAFPAGPSTSKWRSEWNTSARLLDAWAREFCAERGKAAHGKSSGGPKVFSANAHLVFSAFLFPLAVQKVLSDLGFLELPAHGAWKLGHIDAYLTEDPMEVDVRKRRGSHPWSELDSRARWSGIDLSSALGSLPTSTADEEPDDPLTAKDDATS